MDLCRRGGHLPGLIPRRALERNAQKTRIQIQIIVRFVGPHRVACVMRRFVLRHHTPHPAKPINHVVVGANPTHVLQNTCPYSSQCSVLVLFERESHTFGRMEHNSKRSGPLLRSVITPSIMHERLGFNLRNRITLLNPKAIAIKLMRFGFFHLPNPYDLVPLGDRNPAQHRPHQARPI